MPNPERKQVEGDLYATKDVRFCRSCVDETLHVAFDSDGKEFAALCSSCLTRWSPAPVVQLFECEGCHVRILRRDGETKVVPACYRPTNEVERLGFWCSECIVDDVVECA